ncbi:MAG: hypothetical protein Tsb0032_42390 [Kiloniellaceae bacterium]
MKDPRDRFDPRHRPEDPRDVARRELRDGEKLVWADRPSPAVLRKRQLGAFLFAIPFTAFACFWIWGAGQGFGESTMGTIFPFFGLPFLAVGVWTLLKPLRAAKDAEKIVYAITDQRVFVVNSGQGHSVQSYGPRDLTKIERRDHGDGLGDVIFAEEVSWHSGNNRFGLRSGNRTRMSDVGFFGIAEAREVEAAIAGLRRRELASADAAG